MTVKDLIEKLQECNPDAKVCVEAWMNPCANEVKEYVFGNDHYVYIGDDLENLDYELNHDEDEDEEDYTPSSTNGDYSPSNPWDAPGMKMSDFI